MKLAGCNDVLQLAIAKMQGELHAVRTKGGNIRLRHTPWTMGNGASAVAQHVARPAAKILHHAIEAGAFYYLDGVCPLFWTV